MAGARAHFEQELSQLRARLLEYGSVVRAAVAHGLEALTEGDAVLAHEVIARDADLNRMRYEIEAECYRLLVTEQPVAGDMRLVVSGIIIATDLERTADHGKKIARISLRIADDPQPLPLGDIPLLGEKALALVDRALVAVAHRDVAQARAVCEADDEVDALYKQMFNVILSYMLENTRLIAAGTHMLQVAHELERVGDRATNVAERVIYAVTGELIELNV